MSYVGFTGYFGSPATHLNAHNPPFPTADGQTPTPVAQRFERDTSIEQCDAAIDDSVAEHEVLESKPVLPVLYSLNEGINKNWEICRGQY
jgi:hypothetical protein